MKRALFHADDWGLSRAVNEGILELAKRGRLRSASCMANQPYLAHRCDEFLALARKGVGIYLHLNFTYGRPLTMARSIPHKTLLLKSALGLLNEAEVSGEIEAQLGRLLALGFPVEGVNGHHHVHLLPGICGPLQTVMLRHGVKKLLMLDDSGHRPSYLQTRVFRLLGGLKAGIEPVHCGYLLARDLTSQRDFFRKVENGKLPLLVHPALWNDFAECGVTDPLREARVRELKSIVEYLNG